MPLSKLEVRHLSVNYAGRAGQMTHALHDIDLALDPGDFVVALGASGCGKTTLLSCIAGFMQCSDGEIVLDGKRVTGPGAERGVVFQKHALMPWLSVVENVEFGLRMRGVSKDERRRVAQDKLRHVGLEKFAHYPIYEISGGMQQRVGLARALASDPEVMLMDEPLGALDAQTRTVLQEELLRIWEETRKTVVYVTHSIDEAVLLGDRVVIMTAHPGTHKVTFEVDLPRPRSVKTMATPEYAALTGAIWDALEDEVRRALEAQR